VHSAPTSEPTTGAQGDPKGTVAAVAPSGAPTSRSSNRATPSVTPTATPTPTQTSISPTPQTRKPTPKPRLRYRYFPTAGGIVLASCRGLVLRVRATPAFNWGIAQIDRSRSRVVVRFGRNDGLRNIVVIVRCVNTRPVARIQFTRVAPSISLTVGPLRQSR
jgi:hypothetical protein